MIPANDLRIGNLVLSANEIYHPKIFGKTSTILSINDKTVTYIVNEDIPCAFVYSQYIDYINPVPITEEWLKDMGFGEVQKSNKHYAISDPNGFKDAYKISIFPTINNNWHIAFSDTLNGYKDYIPTTKIKYIHQLQNLFWCLCGKELTIKRP